MRQKIHNLKQWYERHEQAVSTGSLLFGFVFDSLTLQRVDSFWDNIWFLVNLILAATCIVFLNRWNKKISGWSYFWLINILQFSFGALLGGFFIFYFRSSALATAWPFLLILLLAMVGNELFQKRYSRLSFQLAFFYLAVFSFTIFLLPIFFHSIGAWVFILSGMTSLVGIWFFVRLLGRFAKEKLLEEKTHVWALVAVIFLTINVLYFTNLIPPIPLSLKDAGVYQYLMRDDRGGYVLGEEESGFLDYFRLPQTVHLASGDSLYVYSAVFSPAELDTRIIHEWQYKDEEKGEWMVATRIPLLLSGGRAEGFRTYSVKESVTAGLWRVNVETPRGQILGRINFRVVRTASRPALRYEVKN